MREIGQGVYGFLFAQRSASIRRTTSGSSTRCRAWSSSSIPQGRVADDLGRKPEAINVPAPRPGGPRCRTRGGRRRRQAARRGGAPAPPVAGVPRRQLQPPDRRRLGRAGQHLRRRRLRQLARRQVRQGRQVHQVVGLDAAPRRASSTRPHASPSTRRATSTSPTAATSASRCSTTTATSRRRS